MGSSIPMLLLGLLGVEDRAWMRNRGKGPKSRGYPASTRRETRFASVLILQDRDEVTFGAGFPSFGCAERMAVGGIGADGDQFPRCGRVEGAGCRLQVAGCRLQGDGGPEDAVEISQREELSERAPVRGTERACLQLCGDPTR